MSEFNILEVIERARKAQQRHDRRTDLQLELEAAEVFECARCGDGDALREGEECAYCGRSEIGT